MSVPNEPPETGVRSPATAGRHSGMVSHFTVTGGSRRRARPRTTALVAALTTLAVLVAGCEAGQIGRQHLMRSSSGSEGRAGAIVVRDALFPFAGTIESGTVYEPGATVRVQATFVNEGRRPDRLVSVSSPVAGDGLVRGDGTIPGEHSRTTGYTEPAAAGGPPGTTAIELRLTELNTPIRSGLTYPVVFTFAHAGEVRLELGVKTPEEPRRECPLPPNGKVPKTLTAPLEDAPAPPVEPPPDCTSIPANIPDVRLLDVAAPLSRPAWSTEHDELVGFAAEANGRHLVRVDPETGETLRSREAEDAGERFGLIPRPEERVALPLTGSDGIALLDGPSLEETDRVDGVPAPSRVTVEESAKTLFALSEDGTTVTGVDHESGAELFRIDVRGGPEAVVRAGDDTDPSFWLVGPDGATYFRGAEPRPEGTHRVSLSPETFSSHDGASKSAYFAEEGSRRVRHLEGDSRGGLEVTRSNEVSETIEHVEAEPEEEHRVYAATADKLIGMKPDTLETIRTTDFRSTLERAGLGTATVSDITVGDDHLYLALHDEPYVLKIRKEEALTE